MNPSEILNRIRNSSEETKRAIWYLHARFIEDDGFRQVADEIADQFAEELILLGAQKYDQWRPYDRASLPGVLKRYCTLANSESQKLDEILFEFHTRATTKAKQRFHLTNIGSQVWKTLDWCLEERRPCFVEGREGRGKTSAARSWHETHRSESRYVSLPGLRTQRDFFDAIASAYGIPSLSKFPGEVRWRLKDVIARSGLILILDEAHHALPERHRAGRPPLIDWIDCDLCNAGVPVVLVSTPQFGPMLSEFEDRTKWNAGQFRRRFSGRWTCLPEKTTDADLAALAQQTMPHVGSKGIKLAVAYAGTFGRDVSGLFDLVRDAERRARKAGHAAVTYQDLRDAFELDRVPSENAMANSFKRPIHTRPGAGEVATLPEAGEPTAAPLQRSRAAESEFTAPDRGTSAPLLVTH